MIFLFSFQRKMFTRLYQKFVLGIAVVALAPLFSCAVFAQTPIVITANDIYNWLVIGDGFLYGVDNYEHDGTRLVLDHFSGGSIVVINGATLTLQNCIGKGNEDWNYSAPHGAGRVMSRAEAKANITLTQYEKAMKGIYTTTVSRATIDEAPFAYKDMQEVIENSSDTMTVVKTIKPLYNFKAGEEK
jgi:hypothetical protein